MVFVGYGVVAPEYGWDDFKGVGREGKDGPHADQRPARCSDPKDPAQVGRHHVQGQGHDLLRPLDLQVRGGLRRRAPPPASSSTRPAPPGYPYAVVAGKLGPRELHASRLPDGDAGRDKRPRAGSPSPTPRSLIAAGRPSTTTQLKAAAVRRDFQPVDLSVSRPISRWLECDQVRTTSLEERRREARGRRPRRSRTTTSSTPRTGTTWAATRKLKGDQIYNGACDNASGVGRAPRDRAASTRTCPRATEPKSAASSLSCASPREEQGLLGARSTTPSHPLYPLTRTLADLNIDGTAGCRRLDPGPPGGRLRQFPPSTIWPPRSVLPAEGRVLTPGDDPRESRLTSTGPTTSSSPRSASPPSTRTSGTRTSSASRGGYGRYALQGRIQRQRLPQGHPTRLSPAGTCGGGAHWTPTSSSRWAAIARQPATPGPTWKDGLRVQGQARRNDARQGPVGSARRSDATPPPDDTRGLGHHHGDLLHDPLRPRRPVHGRARGLARDPEEPRGPLRDEQAPLQAVPRLLRQHPEGRLRPLLQVPHPLGERDHRREAPGLHRARPLSLAVALIIGPAARRPRRRQAQHLDRLPLLVLRPPGGLHPDLRHGARSSSSSSRSISAGSTPPGGTRPSTACSRA
jgi:hypothetical protein